MMKSFAILFLALSAGLAGAQTSPPVQASAALSWTLPTTGCVGTVCTSPLTGTDVLTKLQVYASQAAITDASTAAPVAELPATATSYSYTASVPNGATLYFRVKACNAGGCSGYSSQASKAVRIVVPNVPAGVAVTVTVTLTQE